MDALTFTRDWFSQNIPHLTKLLQHYKDKPCNMLEIGSFEGLSTVWFLQNILTHADSKITCVDPCTGNIEHSSDEKVNIHRHFANNVLKNFPDKVTFFRKMSHDTLKYHDVLSQQFDIVYIDGDHHAHSVMEDAVLSFRLLKKGGFMVFDDIRWPAYLDDPPKHPATGFQGFYHAYGHFFDVVYDGYQVVLQKKEL